MFALEHVYVAFFLTPWEGRARLTRTVTFFLGHDSPELSPSSLGTTHPNCDRLFPTPWAGRARITWIATPHTGTNARSVIMVKTPWANELPPLGLEPGAPCCQSDTLPLELKGYPTSAMLVGRRISIPLHRTVNKIFPESYDFAARIDLCSHLYACLAWHSLSFCPIWWLICANLRFVIFSFCCGEKTTKRYL
jgi:hypothetical protein